MRSQHIRTRLMLYSLIIVLPFLVWNLAMQVHSYLKIRHDSINALRETARDIVDLYRDHMASLIALENCMGETIWGGRTMSPSAMSAYIKSSKATLPEIRNIVITDDEGRIVASDFPALIGLNVSDRGFVQQLMAGKDIVISPMFRGRIIRKPVFVVAHAARNKNNKLNGMVMAIIDDHRLAGVLRQSAVHSAVGDEEIIIADSTGTVMLAYNAPWLSWQQRHWGKYPFIRECTAGIGSNIDRFHIPNGDILTGVAEPINAYNWSVVVFRPSDSLLGKITRQTIANTVFMLLLTGLAVGIALYLGNNIARPVIHLADIARRFGDGELDARAEVDTGDELEALCITFNDMASALDSHDKELRKAADRAHRSAESASALYNVAQAIVISVHVADRLEAIAQALSSICRVKRCTIFLKSGDRMDLTAGWGRLENDDLSCLIDELSASNPTIYNKLMKNSPVEIRDVANELTSWHCKLEETSLKSFLALPLFRRQHLVGVAVLDTPWKHHAFDPDAMIPARSLATLAAIAIENSEAFEKNAKVAGAFQNAMLPAIPERAGDFLFSSSYYAAVQVAELGGDFYDFIKLDDTHIAIVIADVSGKGLEAAVWTAMGKYTVRAILGELREPKEILTRANKTLASVGEDWGFLTMFFGILDTSTGTLSYASAGHPPPVVATATGETLLLTPSRTEPPLGAFDSTQYVQDEYRLEVGDVIVCYTDGVIEARHNGSFFGRDSLADTVKSLAGETPVHIADGVHNAVVQFSRGRVSDDIALLVIKRSGV